MKSFSSLLGLALLCLLYQNCGPGFSVDPNLLSSSQSSASTLSPSDPDAVCKAGGLSYKAGSTLSGYALYSVVAPSSCGSKVMRTCLPSGQFDGPMPVYETCTELSAQANSIDALPPGEWLEIANTKVMDVFPKVSPGGSPYAVVAAWSGGAFDTKRDRMILWGGGHGDYAGNEIYVFDLNFLKWTRLNEPSPVPAGISEFRTGYYPDGGPVSRHTYNYIQYLPDPVDRFCSFGGAAFWQSGQYGTNHTDCFNFDKNMWEPQKFQDSTSSDIGANTAYDPVTQTVYEHGGLGDKGLSKLDLKTGQWTQLWEPFSGAGYTLQYTKTSDIDPIQRMMVAVGGGKILTWDLLKAGPNYATEITTMGPQTIVQGAGGNPGFVYVPDLKAFVGWAGGKDLFKFDLPTKTWTTMPLSPNSKFFPPAEQGNWGTYGRLRYSPAKKVLVLITGHDKNVLVYKVK